MIYSKITPFNADVYTPVELYLSLRNHYRKTCLLESNEYQSRTNSKSYIGIQPILEIKIKDFEVEITKDDVIECFQLDNNQDVVEQIDELLKSYSFENKSIQGNGFLGRFGFEFALLTESQIKKVKSHLGLPDVHLFVFQYIIVIDHFTNNGQIISNSFSKTELETLDCSELLKRKSYTEFPFEVVGKELFEYDDIEFGHKVLKAIEHCKRGDVFQLVLSNSFRQKFFGDDFQVYRELRRLNPSPYLFYFDFEEYRLFGSSPEAQLVVKKGKAEIHPIAGTVLKTGDYNKDLQRIEFLQSDEKENAEHTMLVDLARNDLSKDCINVKVEKYKELQYFSHVIHLVSKVTGQLENQPMIKVLNHSFPAGTLSGTPKTKALELITKMEDSTRDFYGGAIGLIGSDGSLNMAIVIRSMLSLNSELHYRAGAGIVINSIVENEVNEVHHKLKAVRTAIKIADEVCKAKVKIELNFS